MTATSETVASEFKPKMSHDEFITQLRAAGFTEKTLAALDEEDINSDAALKILSSADIETIAKEKGLTIGQKRLLIEFAAKLNPKQEDDSRRPPGKGGYSGRRSDRSRSPATQLKRLNPDASTCLCVFNLTPNTTEQFLFNYFSRIGHVKNVKVVYDKVTGFSRGFAFVYFHDVETAKYVKDSAQGLFIDGQQIRVDYSLTKRAY